MPGNLVHPRLQLIRAKEHFDSLDAAVSMFHTSEPTSISVKEHPATGRKIIDIQQPVPPLRLGILAGDVFVALRSTLDYLSWQLALQTTESPGGRTEFPVVWRENSETDTRLANVLKDWPTAAVEEAKALQPYLRGDAYKDDPLWKIDELCNIAKHKVIPVSGAHVQFVANITEGDIESVVAPRLGQIIYMLTADGSAKLQLHPQVTAGVLFGDDASGIKVTRSEIRNLYEYVRDTVFPKFERFFQPTASAST